MKDGPVERAEHAEMGEPVGYENEKGRGELLRGIYGLGEGKTIGYGRFHAGRRLVGEEVQEDP